MQARKGKTTPGASNQRLASEAQLEREPSRTHAEKKSRTKTLNFETGMRRFFSWRPVSSLIWWENRTAQAGTEPLAREGSIAGPPLVSWLNVPAVAHYMRWFPRGMEKQAHIGNHGQAVETQTFQPFCRRASMAGALFSFNAQIRNLIPSERNSQKNVEHRHRSKTV